MIPPDESAGELIGQTTPPAPVPRAIPASLVVILAASGSISSMPNLFRLVPFALTLLFFAALYYIIGRLVARLPDPPSEDDPEPEAAPAADTALEPETTPDVWAEYHKLQATLEAGFTPPQPEEPEESPLRE